MKRIDFACYGLLASAFVLAGLLVVQVQNHSVLSEARGEMVLNRANLTLMTAQTRPDEEAVFVLDSSSGTLLVYKTDLSVTPNRITLAKSQDVGSWFREAEKAANGSR